MMRLFFIWPRLRNRLRKKCRRTRAQRLQGSWSQATKQADQMCQALQAIVRRLPMALVGIALVADGWMTIPRDIAALRIKIGTVSTSVTATMTRTVTEVTVAMNVVV